MIIIISDNVQCPLTFDVRNNNSIMLFINKTITDMLIL